MNKSKKLLLDIILLSFHRATTFIPQDRMPFNGLPADELVISQLVMELMLFPVPAAEVLKKITAPPAAAEGASEAPLTIA